MADADKEWEEKARGMLRAELARRNIDYMGLSDRLRAIGIVETHKNLSNKITRGKFPASFFLQCLSVIGCRSLHLDERD